MVPEGTFTVGAGLAISGITTYGFQILAFRGLKGADYAALNALWVFVFVLAPGVFLPLEQEVGRALSARRARGVGGGPVVRRAGLLGAAFSVVLALGIVAVSLTTGVVQHKFNDHVGLVVCLVVALFTFGVEFLARGVFAGLGRFGAYGLSLGAEGVIRLLPCIPLAIASVKNPVWYGLCLAVPPLLATAVSMYGQSGLMRPGPPAPWSELSSNLGFLLGGSLLAQVLSYAPFLGAQVLATPKQRTLVANFIVGLFLSRLPILLFQAVQAALLPKLSTLVSAGRDDEFQNGVRKLVMIVVGIGVLGVTVGGTAGPWAGKILFGHKFNLGHADVALLAAGSGLFILTLTLSQALIALSGTPAGDGRLGGGPDRVRGRDGRGNRCALPPRRARLDRRRRRERGGHGMVLHAAPEAGRIRGLAGVARRADRIRPARDLGRFQLGELIMRAGRR